MKFKYDVTGEYITKDGYLDDYELSFVLSTDDEALARSVIQNALISQELRKAKSDFKRWKTCQISDADKAANAATLSLDSEYESLLIKAVNNGCLPQTLTAMKSDEKKKDALKKSLETKKKRVKAEKERTGNIRIEKID